MNGPALKKTWEGQVVDGKFPLRQWIGASDHSVVFLTELGDASRKAAIKLIPASTLNTGQLDRWRPALKLSHPHLLRVFDVGRCELEGVPLFYIVLQFAEEDLSQILPQRPLSSTELGELLPPVLDVVSYLHSQSFAHGAIKPANIHAINDQIKLSSDRLYPIGQASDKVLARTIYDAPELTNEAITPAADVWSLGITIVEALTQVPPATLATREPVVSDAIPEPFRSIARMCLQRDPKQRASMADIRTRLRPAPAAIPAPSTEPLSTQPPRPSMLIPAVVVVSLLVAGILGQRLFSHRSTDNPQEGAVVAEKPALQPAPSLPPPGDKSGSQKTSGQVLHQVLPEVSKSARNTIQGKIKVVVRVNVDSAGKVTAATFTSRGPSQYFADLALNAAREWKFSAPVVNGESTPSAWNIRFQFGRAATKAFPTKVSPH